ncbi:Replication protein A 32 kDa subunit A [Vitis vinifera]|uniref:Replication protein A 32 kDa subunit A n=1 Tax=Vitis vinifera TaxID=29760 RepID=A0A438GTH8_VITVI|nr:Replication protein A 32 kDa subunit A [Vitis vinifera]
MEKAITRNLRVGGREGVAFLQTPIGILIPSIHDFLDSAKQEEGNLAGTVLLCKQSDSDPSESDLTLHYRCIPTVNSTATPPSLAGDSCPHSHSGRRTWFFSCQSMNRDTQALLPLTVKQISEAFLSSDDKSNFLIDGVEVNNVTLVGMVFNKAERVTDVGFMLDDGTGRIDCNRWVNEAVDTKEMEGILDGMYVRVHGHLKGFQGKRHLNVFSIRYKLI